MQLLISVPGIGTRNAAKLLTGVVGHHFKTASHLAPLAGLAPTALTVRGRVFVADPPTVVTIDASSLRHSKAVLLHYHTILTGTLREETSQGTPPKQVISALARHRLDTRINSVGPY